MRVRVVFRWALSLLVVVNGLGPVAWATPDQVLDLDALQSAGRHFDTSGTFQDPEQAAVANRVLLMQAMVDQARLRIEEKKLEISRALRTPIESFRVEYEAIPAAKNSFWSRFAWWRESSGTTEAEKPRLPVRVSRPVQKVLNDLIDGNKFNFVAPGLGLVEPTRLGDAIVYRVLMDETDVAYLFIDKSDQQAVLDELGRSQFRQKWQREIDASLDRWVESLSGGMDVDEFSRRFLEKVDQYNKENSLLEHMLAQEAEQRQAVFDQRLKKYVARQHREAGTTRTDGVTGRHVVIAWQENGGSLSLEQRARPARFSAAWWDEFWTSIYTKPTTGDINSGVMAGLFQVFLGLVPPTALMVFGGAQEFYWQMSFLNFLFGTTIGIYGATYSNWVNSGKRVGFWYNMAHMMKASTFSLMFSVTLAIMAPGIYMADPSTYTFFSMTTLGIAAYLLTSAAFNNFLKSNIRNIPRVREKARANTTQREIKIPLTPWRLTVSQKNLEYQVYTEGFLNLSKNLDLIKFDLFGASHSFFNTSRMALVGMAIASGPIVSWMASTRYPRVAREMGIYQDPKVYGESIWEFTGSWFREAFQNFGTWVRRDLVEFFKKSPATHYRESRDHAEARARVRRQALEREQREMSALPQNIDALSPACRAVF